MLKLDLLHPVMIHWQHLGRTPNFNVVHVMAQVTVTVILSPNFLHLSKILSKGNLMNESPIEDLHCP